MLPTELEQCKKLAARLHRTNEHLIAAYQEIDLLQQEVERLQRINRNLNEGSNRELLKRLDHALAEVLSMRKQLNASKARKALKAVS